MKDIRGAKVDGFNPATLLSRFRVPLICPPSSGRDPQATEGVQDRSVRDAELFRDRSQGLTRLVHRRRGRHVEVGQDAVARLDAGPLQNGEDGSAVDIKRVGQPVGRLTGEVAI